MFQIMIYNVLSRSELFRTKFQTKLCNVIVFDTGTSFACVWCVPKSKPIRN